MFCKINQDEYTQASEYHKILLNQPDRFLGHFIRMEIPMVGSPIITTITGVQMEGEPILEPADTVNGFDVVGWEPFFYTSVGEKCRLPDGLGSGSRYRIHYRVTHINFQAGCV